MRNGIFAALVVVFVALSMVFLGTDLYMPGPVLLGLAIAFVVLGLALVVLTVRGAETGRLRFFLILTGACAAAIPVSAVVHNFVFHAFLFILTLLILPLIFLVAWVVSVVLLATAEKPVSSKRKLLIGGFFALSAAAIVRVLFVLGGDEEPEITSQVLGTPQEEIRRVFVIADADAALMDVVYHSFEHSLVSALESNGIAATVALSPEESEETPDLRPALVSFGPDAIMYVSLEPLYRSHHEGFEAIVGTVFNASLSDGNTGQTLWQLFGKVDYVPDRCFDAPGYATSHGMKREFAFGTTAAIVRTYMLDMHGRESEPIYTWVEQRESKGLRAD